MNKIISFIRRPSRLAVEIGDWIKIAESALTPAGFKISKINVKKTLDIKGDLSSGIKGMLKEAGIKTNQAILIISRQFVTIRNLELPSTDDKEIREIIDLQASKQTPYSREEIIFGFKSRKSLKEGYSDVLLAIAKKDIIEERIKVLKDAGLDAVSVRLGSEAIYQYFLLLNKDKQDRTILFIDIDSVFSDVMVISKNNLEYSRNIPIGKDFILANPDSWKDALIEEVKRTLGIYQHEAGSKNIEQILCAGTTEGLNGLLPALRAEFNLSVDTAGFLGPPLLFDKTTSSYTHAAKHVSLSSVSGILCPAENPDINLLPQDAEIEKQIREKTKNITNTGILVILFFALLSAILTQKFYVKSSYYNTLHEKFVRTEKESSGIEAVKVRVDTIREYLDAKGSVLNVLQELSAVMPAEVYLTSINYKKNKEVILAGTSETMSDVFKLVTLMEELGCFEKVKTNYATKKKKENKEVVDFELSCPIME
jgi:Tfp pilus assembly PilM family ATPase